MPEKKYENDKDPITCSLPPVSQIMVKVQHGPSGIFVPGTAAGPVPGPGTEGEMIDDMLNVFRRSESPVTETFVTLITEMFPDGRFIVDKTVNDSADDNLTWPEVRKTQQDSFELRAGIPGVVINLSFAPEDYGRVSAKWKDVSLLMTVAKHELNREQAARQQLDIVAAAIHDINNKLAIILPDLDYLKTYSQALTGEAEATIDEIRFAVLEANRIAQQCMHLVSAGKGMLKLKLKLSDPDKLIKRVADPYRDRCLIISEPDLEVLWDEDKMERVVDNLIGNAIKFSRGGLVIVETGTDGLNLTIRVIDRGPGLKGPPEALFEPYVRGAGSETIPGHGIGLSYCRLICELHGGTITAANNENRAGACFEVKIPVGDRNLISGRY